MAEALALAREGLGTTSPNPSVGAVLVNEGRVVGKGRTQPPGQAHAEIVALREAGEAARGATLYVTLEPCAHHGRTPPCADAIVAAGVREVRVATLDPNPKTDGKGVRVLREAGIGVTIGDGEADAQQAIEAFAKHVRTGLPFVTAKFAMSLDGKVATRAGDSIWITGEEARRVAHQLRAESDAVMVGVGTVLADNPRLTVRDVPTKGDRQPMRVVIDSEGRTPADAALLSQPGQTLVAVADIAASQRAWKGGSGAVLLPGEDGRVDLRAVLELLGQQDVTSVLVEGGPTLLGSLFDAGLVDKVIAFVAPTIIGGETAKSAVGGLGAARMADALRLRDVSYRQAGDDMMVIGYPAREE
ncbi:MAG: bifunctional diaminohydroxyphosphoribosylaminopyrimidine deaminase/5-amino-6-(5-phosphoribosylamino)uracil reductase RibD [SAR202 cluster bacterium]|nr:bifunctional diaminohydroxyphosphoribosylaminopyrimidine deaminase/5-amino-6-(5-phosphoribosylamino)uracil reductase RibD [SAR202 cluster bacterium]